MIPGCRAFASFYLVLSGLSCADHEPERPLHSVVDGHWMTECVPHAPPYGSYQVVLDFCNAYDAMRTEILFADDNCLAAKAQLQYTGHYELIVTSRDFVYGMDLFYDSRSGLNGLPVPLKNLNLVQIDSGHSLEFGSDLADENERPLEVRADQPLLNFFYQPSH